MMSGKAVWCLMRICWGVPLSGSSAGPLRAGSGNSPSFRCACRPGRNSPRRPDAPRLSGSSAPWRNGLARGAGRSRRPVALLAGKQDRRPEEVSPAEAASLMAGSVLELLEIGGPDAVREQLEELPRSQREEVVRAAERGVE